MSENRLDRALREAIASFVYKRQESAEAEAEAAALTGRTRRYEHLKVLSRYYYGAIEAKLPEDCCALWEYESVAHEMMDILSEGEYRRGVRDAFALLRLLVGSCDETEKEEVR